MSAATRDLTVPPCVDDDEAPELVECEHCWRRVDEDELTECAGGLPAWPILECPDCLAECGICRDESAREWWAEQRADIRRFGP